MTVILSLISSIFAAFLAHSFATSRMRKNDLSGFQLIAYSDFIGAASRLAVSRRLGNTTNNVEDLAILNDAKNRILICGDKRVVKELIEFWDHGGTLEREQELLAFMRMSTVIRETLGHKKHDITDLKISKTLFKLEPSEFSFKEKYSKESE